ncbi:hypothetical protein C8J56DRAFT_1048896 [Mycena floridula]|nr:hypothetical protein C8J56DRAFT_1048896 [Mycena floridula]
MVPNDSRTYAFLLRFTIRYGSQIYRPGSRYPCSLTTSLLFPRVIHGFTVMTTDTIPLPPSVFGPPYASGPIPSSFELIWSIKSTELSATNSIINHNANLGSNKTDNVVPNSTHHHDTAIPPQDYSGTGIDTMGAGGNRPKVMGQHPQGGMMNEGRYGAAGTNMAPTTGMGHHAGGMGHHDAGLGHHNGTMGIPPTPIANTENQSHGSGHSLAGKLERKEQEAKAAKVQISELAEAERLEAEALMRRERTVAHGAHPDNRHLGSSSMPGRTQ